MKQTFILLLSLLSLAANADTVEIDGVYYSLNAVDKTAWIMSNPNKYTGAVIIPESVSYNGNEYNVTSISNRAFYGCIELTSVTIGNSVKSIDY